MRFTKQKYDTQVKVLKIDHLPVYDLILNVYAFDIFYYLQELFPLRFWFLFQARATKMSKKI